MSMNIKNKKWLVVTALLALPLNAAQADLSQNLVGYYPFESGFNNSVTTGGLPNGTAVNTPVAGSAGGKVGNGVMLQGGQNDHMNLVASFGSGNTLGTNFTVSAWYNLNEPITSTSSSGRYFVYESSNDYDVSFGLRDLGNGVAGPNDGQVYTQTGNFSVADAGAGGWHHVIQTYTESGADVIIKTWIDGRHVGDLSIAVGSFTGNGFNFGSARSSQAVRGFDGMIDEVAIWDRALTTAELASVYALGLNSKPVVSSAPADPSPTINSFTASPDTTTLGGTVSLAWNVSGSSSVTIVDELGNVGATGTQNVTLNTPKTFTLVAINGNAVETSQVSVAIDGPTDPVGPYVGTLKQTEAYFLYRPGAEVVNLRLTVMTTQGGAAIATDDATSAAEDDNVAKFHITGLTAGTKYFYKIEKLNTGGGTTMFAGDTADHHFTTVPAQRTGQNITVAFASCVNDSTDGVWAEMANHNPSLLCLSGDTPYVDTGALPSIRSKHRDLLQRPNLAALGKNVSVVGTWDDHDFGLNGGNGVNTASRKVNTRRGFIEYRAHDRYGDGSGNGIYHKVDMGAIEIFLLDPRWFSQTAASPINANESTCFGNAQWQWILDSIRASKAPFKVLLQGQIWQDKKNSETDDMFTYWAERDKLLDIIRDEKIPGVVLFGGDIHVARYLKHPQRLGYDLHDFIMSPGHTGVISSLNVHHPSLEWHRDQPNQFLTMTADTTKSVPELTVRYLDAAGMENHKVVIPYTEVSFQQGNPLAQGLRGYWNFDNNTNNQSVLGSRIDGQLVGGASVGASNGVLGGALSMARASNQYLNIPRSFLDDNASAYTASAWCKPTSLPAHGSEDRHFIMETGNKNHTGLGNVSGDGYGLSIGMRASSTDASKVRVELYTLTLLPRAVGSQQAPGRTAHVGGFDVDRTVFDNWTHVVVTFDSTKLVLYVNGVSVFTHTLTTPAPIAESAGLVIGGHRDGTGRNFDGLIDEVAIWNRVLAPAEITTVYGAGSPAAIPTSVAILDTDGDALPDFWENLHGLDKDSSTDVSSDFDDDGLNAMQEFGFGTLPGTADRPHPYVQTTENVSGVNYQAVTYKRDPAALAFLDVVVQRSTDLGIGDAWSAVDTVVVSVTPLPDGREQVTERSTVAIDGQTKEFLRVRFSKK
ncbi:MAG: LamG-like jellyroll fold domain-containing protein [Akkermansiaceae bacterium]